MSFPLFRFTLGNTIAGSLVIDEPGGWDEAKLKLERNQEYHSIVELYDQPLTFYGSNATENGGLDYIVAIETSQGPDAQITILIEISEDEGVSYSTVYQGLLDITTIKEIDFYKQECGIIRDDFWQKFMNRRTIPCDISGAVDMDENAIAAVSPISFTLTGQRIQQSYYAASDATNGTKLLEYTIPGPGYYAGLDIFTQVTLNEIKDRVPVDNVTTTAQQPMFKVLFAGTYVFNIVIYAWGANVNFKTDANVNVYLQINLDAPVGLARADTGVDGVNGQTVYTLGYSVALLAGDQIKLDIGNGAAGPRVISISGAVPAWASILSIVAQTDFPNSTVEAFRIYDAGKSIIEKMTGVTSSLVSAYFGAGCGLRFNLMKGVNVRGYSLADKPFTMSFQDWWDGANPIFNLGLGYDSGADVIRIEQKTSFYDKTTSLNLSLVNNIERSYYTDLIFKSIEIGYQKWSAESSSGIDDPQTKHNYHTYFKTVGNDISLLSKFYAASLGIEQTRRNGMEIGKDWKLDNDIMIIATNHTDQTIPELTENFDSVTNLLNASSRYNIILSPGRNFFRWRDFFNGCLVWNGGNVYAFDSGEGNIIMSSDINEVVSGLCDAIEDLLGFTENQNIVQADANGDRRTLFVPVEYTFTHPLSFTEYNTIKNNRTKAIGVSRTSTGHVACHIKSLEYEITKGKAKFVVFLANNTPIT